jgi:hypothetical protein
LKGFFLEAGISREVVVGLVVENSDTKREEVDAVGVVGVEEAASPLSEGRIVPFERMERLGLDRGASKELSREWDNAESVWVKVREGLGIGAWEVEAMRSSRIARARLCGMSEEVFEGLGCEGSVDVEDEVGPARVGIGWLKKSRWVWVRWTSLPISSRRRSFVVKGKVGGLRRKV